MSTPYAVSSDLVSAWPAKSLEVATYLDTALASKTDLAMTQNAQTGSSYSYALTDASKLLTMSNASANTVLLTKQATVSWVTGTQLRVLNLGAGVTTLVADTGVTINGNVSLKQYQGGTLIRTASDVWAFVPTASSGGMDLITPTSVAGTGVTLSGGQVSFSAATSISINGCFTSAYTNYRIFVDAVSAAAPALQIRMRLSGTDNSAASYAQQYLDAGATTVSAARATGATSAGFGDCSTSGGWTTMDLFNPALASPTYFLSMTASKVAGPSLTLYSGGHNVSTAFDGFSVIPSSSNLTGSLRIYGLRSA